jgi:hypothetical protein
MIWTVVWRPVAEASLAELWTNGPDRAEIARAADEIDARLRRDPQNEGESRTTESVRITVLPPLAALFEISDPDRLVTVLKVWRINR